LMQVGEEFCGSKSEVLQESIKRQSVNYFKNYHRISQNVGGFCRVLVLWGASVRIRLPFMCDEFKFMGQCRSPSVSPSRQAASSVAPALEEPSLFQQYHQDGNPFEMHIEHKEEETEDVLASNGVLLQN
ncbi:hypothetical protein GOODEAATRI_004461, partial [Goodea atripinnis]